MKNFPIVRVGGSADGLDAYIRLLQNIDFVVSPEDIAREIVRIARGEVSPRHYKEN